MSYIPPHLRVSDGGSKSKPSPAVPPSSSGHPTVERGRSKQLLPDVIIKWSVDSTTRFIVLHHHESLSCQHVEFVEFERETFAHLEPHQLYILADPDPGQQNTAEIVEAIPRLSLQERSHSANAVFAAFQEDIKNTTKRFEGFVQSQAQVPSVWLWFGKLLFRAGRSSYDWKRSYMPEEVERDVETSNLLKTFDNCLSKEEFMFLHEVAHKDALHSSSKERIIIEVADEMRSGGSVFCVCPILDVNEQTLDPNKRHHASETAEPVKAALVLKRVRSRVVRHLVGDVACVGKRSDLRFMFYSKENITGLSEEDLCDLKSMFSKASVNSTAKGGLQWPLGSRHSSSGRFHVVASSHEKLALVVRGGLTWRLQTCNRVEFKASTGRFSYDVALRPIIYHEFCKGRENRTAEELLQSIEDSLQQLWLECL